MRSQGTHSLSLSQSPLPSMERHCNGRSCLTSPDKNLIYAIPSIRWVPSFFIPYTVEVGVVEVGHRQFRRVQYLTTDTVVCG